MFSMNTSLSHTHTHTHTHTHRPVDDDEEARSDEGQDDAEDGSDHIVIIRTPSEPDVDRIPEPVTQEKPDPSGEVPLVTISAPYSNTA